MLFRSFEARLADADRYGLRHRCIVDPGTGFAPSNWPWEERYLYQKRVYSNLDALRRWGLPIYIALPWKDTPQHWELMEIVLRAFFDASMSLRGVLYLVDPRVPDSPVDHAALEWILDQEIPLQVLAARSDHLARTALDKALQEIKKHHGLSQLPLPVSSKKKTGLAEVWEELMPLVIG